MTFAISTLKQPSFITKRDTKKNKILHIVDKFSQFNGAYFLAIRPKRTIFAFGFQISIQATERTHAGARATLGTRLFGHACVFLGKVKKGMEEAGRIVIAPS